ncbi:flagellar motor protein MotB [Salinisphaera sp. Q1T1-3]|uniref:flagellar motor protein MotB n=1 Tax=Salinisphaera sp. Q1T1-3 TaxID=2321229 RepID=UPI000E756286|nr:flagellar motor protein MotB [Salinisphaera sp. Q1T1-3]RJS95188.1 motility protein MotB [Salinisphaera sp. Q1T1-3]
MSNNSGDRRPIVIRRKRHTRHAAHGTWKIAYADFMTALMAFFLVMWLLSGLNDSQLENVGEYFRTPLKVALAGGDRQSASNSAIPGGGDDPVHSDGEVALTSPRATNYHADDRRLARLRAEIQAQIEQDPKLSRMSSQVRIEMVPDGLRLQIFDSRRRPMFKRGSARLEPDIALLLERLAGTLSSVKNKITITGHTDDLPYASGPQAYSNWELSADRANAARRALVTGGMVPTKLLRVIGAADTDHVAGDQPDSPLNRRISILLLNDRAQRRIEEGPAREAAPTTTARATPEADVAPRMPAAGAVLGWVAPKVPSVTDDIQG